MSGNKESHIQYVNDVDKTYGLNQLLPNDDINTYLNYDINQLRNLSQKECAEISYVIACYALYLKKEENKYIAICSRIKNALDQIVFKEIGNFGTDTKYMKYEEKVHIVSNDNDAARELRDSLNNFTSSREYLSFLSSSISNIASSLNDVRKSKYELKTG